MTVITSSYFIVWEKSDLRLFLWIPVILVVFSIIISLFGFLKKTESTLIVSLAAEQFNSYKKMSEAELSEHFIENLQDGLTKTNKEINDLVPYFNWGFLLFIISAISFIILHILELFFRIRG